MTETASSARCPNVAPVARGLRWMYFALAVIACGFSVPWNLHAQAPKPTEYEVEAAYLSNFGRFVEWPARAGSATDTFYVCVLGQDPFGPLLDAALKGETIARRADAGEESRGAGGRRRMPHSLCEFFERFSSERNPRGAEDIEYSHRQRHAGVYEARRHDSVRSGWKPRALRDQYCRGAKGGTYAEFRTSQSGCRHQEGSVGRGGDGNAQGSQLLDQAEADLDEHAGKRRRAAAGLHGIRRL